MLANDTSMAAISVVHDHAVKAGYITDKESVLFLSDVQEGLVKDGLGENSILATFLSSIKALAKPPSSREIGVMLRKVAFGHDL